MYMLSKEQYAPIEKIQSAIENGKRAKIELIAPAGTGKTSTALGVIDNFSSNNKMVYLVFNTDMQKETSQRLSYSTSQYQNINTENIDVYTFHAFVRKELLKLFPNVKFDFENGKPTQEHLKMIFPELEATGEHNAFIEAFNNYAHGYVTSTKRLENFVDTKDSSSIAVNEQLINTLKKIGAINNKEHFDVLDIQRKAKETFDSMLTKIFKQDALVSSMPHSIYYKYMHEQCENEDIFKEYGIIIIDEAQDIDPIIMSFAEKSKAHLLKMGDNFQQIYAFKGTVNGLGVDTESDVLFLSKSYRLSPYMGLLASAFLEQKGKEFGYREDVIPVVYGHQKHKDATKNTIKNTMVQTASKDEYSDIIIKNIMATNFEESDIVQELKKQKREIEHSIVNQKEFKSAIKKFTKDKDYLSFFEALEKHSTYFGLGENKTNILLEDMDLDIQAKSKISAGDMRNWLEDEKPTNSNTAKRELNRIAKACSFSLSKKEKSELLATDGTYAFLARNNNEVIDTLYNFVAKIPYAESEIPLFQIKFTSSVEDKIKGLIKHNFKGLTTREKSSLDRIMQESTSNVINGMSVMNNYLYLDSISMPLPIIKALLKDSSVIRQVIEAPRLLIGGVSHSLADYGATVQESHKIFKDALKATKSAMTKNKIDREVTAEDIIKYSSLTSVAKLINFSTFIESTMGKDGIFNTSNNNLINMYKLSKIYNAVENNPNIVLSNNSFYNVYMATTHKVKGLEFHNIYMSNDIFVQNEEGTANEDKNEMQLAYVAFTRTKNAIYTGEEANFKKEIDEVVSKNYSRFYATRNNILLEEKLVKSGVNYNIHSLDELTQEYKMETIMLLENSQMLSYSDMIIAKEKSGALGLMSKFDKRDERYVGFDFVAPIKTSEAKEMIENFKAIDKDAKISIEKEAELVF